VHLSLGQSGANVPFQSCTAQSCQAVVALDTTVTNLLTNNQTLEVGYSVANGQNISYKLPTTGFDKAMAAWQSLEPPPPPPPSPPPAPTTGGRATPPVPRPAPQRGIK